MKKFLILLFAPLLMATQCDEDVEPLYATEFFIQNNSSVDLLYLTEDAMEIVIESNSRESIAFDTNATQTSIPPSENTIFNSLTLFKEDLNGNMVTAYEQEPINNQLWEQNGSGDFDFGYTLIITDDLIE